MTRDLYTLYDRMKTVFGWGGRRAGLVVAEVHSRDHRTLRLLLPTRVNDAVLYTLWKVQAKINLSVFTKGYKYWLHTSWRFYSLDFFFKRLNSCKDKRQRRRASLRRNTELPAAPSIAVQNCLLGRFQALERCSKISNSLDGWLRGSKKISGECVVRGCPRHPPEHVAHRPGTRRPTSPLAPQTNADNDNNNNNTAVTPQRMRRDFTLSIHSREGISRREWKHWGRTAKVHTI